MTRGTALPDTTSVVEETVNTEAIVIVMVETGTGVVEAG